MFLQQIKTLLRELEARDGSSGAGYHDGSTAVMQAGASYMQSRLGTIGAHLHPNDNQSSAGSNPMSSTQSNVLHASSGDA